MKLYSETAGEAVKCERKRTQATSVDVFKIKLCVCVRSAVDKAYKMLLESDQKKKALDVVHAGKEYVEHMVRETSEHFWSLCLIPDDVYVTWWCLTAQMAQKKKQLKKDGKASVVEEDDPELVWFTM